MKTNVLYPIELSSFDATSLTNAYQVVNVNGIPLPCSVINIVNTSGVPIMLSFDGINDHDVVRAYGHITYNFQLNAESKALLKKFTKLYVKYILGAGKGGDIYVTGYTDFRG